MGVSQTDLCVQGGELFQHINRGHHHQHQPGTIKYMKTNKIHLLCVSETHISQPDSWLKEGYEFLFSGSPENKSNGVGFVVSPLIKHFTYHYVAGFHLFYAH